MYELKLYDNEIYVLVNGINILLLESNEKFKENTYGFYSKIENMFKTYNYYNNIINKLENKNYNFTYGECYTLIEGLYKFISNKYNQQDFMLCSKIINKISNVIGYY